MKKLLGILFLLFPMFAWADNQTMNPANWTFDASARTVTIDSIANLRHVLRIVNTTDEVTIYEPSDPDRGGSQSGKVVTLDFNTTQMSDGDALWITYETANLVNSAAFGELSVATPFPEVQLQFTYNLNPDLIETRLNNGAATVSGGLVSLSTTAGANRSAQLLSRRPVKYNAGQGTLNRFTAIFTACTADSTQYMGIGNTSDGFFIGCEGTDFGVMRRRGGVPEIRTFTVTTKSTTAENITITLDGVSSGDVVAVTDATATDVTTTANEIAAHDYSNVGPGWTAHVMGDNVIFESFSAASLTGVYSLSSATTAVASVAQTLAGTTATDSVTNLADFSEGPLPFTIDVLKGNVYQIRYQWLGFGSIGYYIENPRTGEWHLMHMIGYANANIIPSLSNPTLPLMAMVKNTGNTTDIVLQSASMAGFTEGVVISHTPPANISASKDSVGTSETPILSLHNHTIFQNILNRVEVDVLSLIVSVDGTKPAIIRLRKNPILTGASFSAIDVDRSVLRKDTSATIVTGGTVQEFTVSKEGVIILGSDIFQAFHLQVTDTLTLSAEATSGTTNVRVSFGTQDFF